MILNNFELIQFENVICICHLHENKYTPVSISVLHKNNYYNNIS